ncbi:AraC family transcriptional regulator [Leucobacter sp. wl10]|uniref:AraC family transcriptional regulator n=1 Tax=Leucobacter sp. wl10 TaxID=2304677 RepID=UPI000E5BD57D|nr:AraC family transcriptional regulator [Leucobacter sp. wl10]RGE21006.1 AraC family transcriptional regulator [Leucobacter sp. wl10]
MTSSDRLTPLLQRFRVRTSLFFTGTMCGTTRFPLQPGRGFLHILRRGEMTATHREDDGALTAIDITRPTLLFYPRPREHAFRNAPIDGSDFTCAALDFDDGETHPLLRTLPSVVVIPLEEVTGLEPVLQLLFDEVDDVRCGRRLVADRLFEVVLIQLLRWILDHVEQLGVPAGLLTGLADARLTPALVALHEEPERDWTLQTMAREARMSRSAFAAHFREVVGLAPGEYLTQWRLTLARRLLRAGTAVSAVATEVGYGSASSFSRAFAQHVGCSPRDWASASLRDAAEA